MKDFQTFYYGTEIELEEDLQLLKLLKKQISLYLKESKEERLHSIFNKIFVLRKNIDKDRFYEVLLEEMNSLDKKLLLAFLLKKDLKEEIPNEWKFQKNNLLLNHKIKENLMED